MSIQKIGSTISNPNDLFKADMNRIKSLVHEATDSLTQNNKQVDIIDIRKAEKEKTEAGVQKGIDEFSEWEYDSKGRSVLKRPFKLAEQKLEEKRIAEKLDEQITEKENIKEEKIVRQRIARDDAKTDRMFAGGALIDFFA